MFWRFVAIAALVLAVQLTESNKQVGEVTKQCLESPDLAPDCKEDQAKAKALFDKVGAGESEPTEDEKKQIAELAKTFFLRCCKDIANKTTTTLAPPVLMENSTDLNINATTDQNSTVAANSTVDSSSGNSTNATETTTTTTTTELPTTTTKKVGQETNKCLTSPDLPEDCKADQATARELFAKENPTDDDKEKMKELAKTFFLRCCIPEKNRNSKNVEGKTDNGLANSQTTERSN